ncbi:MAG: hypothetical protein M3N53_11085 [Actinomycetota bacterium]|nr:hypothetical protein [Actinomycetota bacterium]
MIVDEEGSALLEPILLGLVLLVPVALMLGSLAQLHRAALAATAAARDGGFAAARAADATEAVRAADAAVAAAFQGHGVSSSRADAEVQGLGSFQRGSPIEVRVSVPVRVLSLPFLGAGSQPSVTVRARHVARIDPYRSRS